MLDERWVVRGREEKYDVKNNLPPPLHFLVLLTSISPIACLRPQSTALVVIGPIREKGHGHGNCTALSVLPYLIICVSVAAVVVCDVRLLCTCPPWG